MAGDLRDVLASERRLSVWDAGDRQACDQPADARKEQRANAVRHVVQGGAFYNFGFDHPGKESVSCPESTQEWVKSQMVMQAFDVTTEW